MSARPMGLVAVDTGGTAHRFTSADGVSSAPAQAGALAADASTAPLGLLAALLLGGWLLWLAGAAPWLIFGFALAPNEKVQLPLIGFFFCVCNCKSNAFASIISKGFVINAKYHIINFNNAICRRFSTYMSNKNLPTKSSGSTLLAFEKISRLGVNPTTQPRSTKVVSQLDICRFVFGKIRRNRVFGLGKSLLAGNKQNN